MSDFVDVDWNSSAVASAGPLGILGVLVGYGIADKREIYQYTGVLILLDINSLVELVELIGLPPVLCVFELIEGV